jgi:hypothetical protein
MIDLTSSEQPVVWPEDLQNDTKSMGAKVQQRETRVRLSARKNMKNLKNHF